MAEHANKNVPGTEIEVLSPEKVQKRDRMRQLLEAHFQDSVLYKLYEKKGRLHELFTANILDMDEFGEYSSKEAAAICEVVDYTINNRRSALVDYVDPKYRQMNSKNWKHDYVSVFKLKMIIGLTGQNGDYSLRQIKAMLYGDLEETTEIPQTEVMHQMFAQMKKYFEDTQDMFERNEQLLLDSPISDLQEKVEVLENQLAEQMEEREKIEKANQELMLVKEKCNEIYDLINDPQSTVLEKQELIQRYDTLVESYPDHRDLIMNYHTYAVNKVSALKELSDKELKHQAKELHNKVMNESIPVEQRNRAMDELEKLFNDHPDHQEKLYHLLYDAKTKQRLSRQEPAPEKPKGIFARLFGR
ncbi:hypothetical protein [Aneurinibacillus tyrosinisolvens]|uniref:hypothetical protein n=1 Tax=Aneurinibacillus tyrosinisolvens TaxID=1443435 RepID=UPI00063F3527|nr:hypothetical protein [Aneurinibacillus tyrosinisolvens]